MTAESHCCVTGKIFLSFNNEEQTKKINRVERKEEQQIPWSASGTWFMAFKVSFRK